MIKPYTGAVSVCLFLCLAAPRCAAAGEPAPAADEVYIPNKPYATVVSYDTVVVTAKRAPEPVGESAQDVYVISGEAIRELPARDVAGVLTYMPAVDVLSNGFPGRPTSLSINGSEARHVRVMVDGIPFNTQLSGQANPAQFPVEYVDRIEVLKGPASSAWGSGLGGVVNVITRPVGTTARPQGEVTASFAEFGTFRHSLELTGAVQQAGYYVTASQFETDGPLPVSDVRETNGFGKIRVPLGDTTAVTGQFGYVTSDSRYAGPVSTAIAAQPYRSRFGQLKIDTQGDRFSWGAAVKFNDQDIRTHTLSLADESELFTTVSQDFYKGLNLNGRLDLQEYGVLVMGADFEYHRLKSNNYLDSSRDVMMQAPYINHTVSREHWDVVFGLRYDHNDRFGSQVSPSLGGVYYFQNAAQTLIRARVARGFNAPPLLWLFNDDPALLVGANPDLKAERAVVYEVGVESRFKKLQLQLNLYRADVRDAIALEFDPADFVFVQRNFEEFRRQGVQLLADYLLTKQVSVYASGAFNDVEDRQTGETVRDQGIARQRFTFGGRYRNNNGFSCHLLGYYKRWSSPARANPNDRKPIFDLRLSQTFKDVAQHLDVELFLNVHNLTNSKYWSSEDFPLPERYFEGGLSIKF